MDHMWTAPAPNFNFQMPSPNGIITQPLVPETQASDNTEVSEAEIGTEATIKNFYEGLSTCGCCVNWTQIEPEQTPKSVEQSNEKAALRVYKVKDHSSHDASLEGLNRLRYSAIHIQSPHILAIVRPLFTERGTITTDNQIIKISEPFEELFFSYQDIIDRHNTQVKGTEEFEHMKLLVDLMREIFKNSAAEVKGLMAEGLMTFEHAWTLFSKNIIVYAKTNGQDRLFQVVSVKLELKTNFTPIRWAVSCRGVHFDGCGYGFRTTSLYVNGFEGNREIEKLAVYPLGFHPDTTLEERLVERGRRVVKYQDTKSREYDGIALDWETKKQYWINSRIVVDSFAYYRNNPTLNGPLTPLNASEGEGHVGSPHGNHTSPYYAYDGGHLNLHRLSPFPDPFGRPTPPPDNTKRPTAEVQESNKQSLVSKRQHLFTLSPWLHGISLDSKQWLLFAVDNVHSMRWNDEAFSHLVYREDHKDLLLTFVQNHAKVRDQLTDVISGKGEGLIALLSGPPGTGKTLSAEAIADLTRRPLYHLKAEELGIKAETLGPNLSRALQLCTDWDAVLLLDEADVFLAKRDSDNIVRTELVSIFLRELEYFRGIMFLTTNLLANIDEAFRSRIQIHLLYPPLSETSRAAVWTKFLYRSQRCALEGVDLKGSSIDKIAGNTVSIADIDVLARWNLNGRDIKNVVKTVQTWCTCKGFEMDLARLETGIQVTAPFSEKRAVCSGEKPARILEDSEVEL